MSPAVVVLVAALGAVVGRIAAFAVERVPLDEPRWSEPRSCAACETPRASLARVPVVGPLVAPCSSCGARIPAWEPAFDVAMAGVFGLFAARFDEPTVLVAYLVLGASLVTLSAIDLQTLRLPDRLTGPTMLAGLLLLAVAALATDRTDAMVPAIVGSAAYFGVLLVTHLVYPRGMGFGDVKLAAPMGLYLGFLETDPLAAVSLVLYAMLLGFAGGSVAGVLVVAVRRRSVPYPFGPFIAMGTVVAIVMSRSLGR